ncbi:hypothetical protein MASR1M107_24300 [Ignavibacteriales bacterium]
MEFTCTPPLWAIWAFAKFGKPEEAYRVVQGISPIMNGMEPDLWSAEPFVTPGNIDGPDSPNYGRAGWTWYTGSASWYQKVFVDWILGVRAEDEGLMIDPVIPSVWDGFKIKDFTEVLFTISKSLIRSMYRLVLRRLRLTDSKILTIP